MSQHFISPNAKVIAVDFDGTIVEHQYPRIGDEMLFAFDTLKALQGQGHKLILWTFRTGSFLDEAVEYCKKNGVEFYAINRNYPEENTTDPKIARKLNADIFIDDRNVGGFLGWGTIYQMLHPEDREFNHQFKNPEAHHNYKKQRKGFLSQLFSK
jgi:hydroxymethylpyrimidine pyrophosphatase-like HAD family hydrolase